MAITYPHSHAILAQPGRRGPIARLLEQEHWLAVVLLLPKLVLLDLFIGYPFVKGVMLSVPNCTWLMMGYFEAIPREVEECARIDVASPLAMTYIIIPLALPGILSAASSPFTLFIYALVFLSSPPEKMVPVGVTCELIRGDVFLGSRSMAGSLLGPIRVAFMYAFFGEHYVAGLTGSIKG